MGHDPVVLVVGLLGIAQHKTIGHAGRADDLNALATQGLERIDRLRGHRAVAGACMDQRLDACLAVKAGKADAAAYDKPILKNIAAKNSGLVLLPDMITTDQYGFAVHPDKKDLKVAMDETIAELKKNGTYDAMLKRWLPDKGEPAAMPDIPLTGKKGVLRFGTSAVTEPFSFVDGKQKIVGFDIEMARYIARKLDMQLEVVNMDFGGMIPALKAGKVDMIGACITITDERARSVLFSQPYYTGGIAALVKQ